VSAVAATQLDDRALVQALLRKDERAAEQLLARYGGAMTRLAASLVGSGAVADEVVQETWIAVLRGVDRFEGRSSLKTWIFSILANIAKTQAQRERRTVPLSSFEVDDVDEPVVDASLFRSDGHWISAPSRWSELPEERLLAAETLGCVARTLETLPSAQRAVMTLRDVDGWSGEEVCQALGLSEANQRVLLHRARSKVRAALEAELG
jgi:RNA polymerase sigma-70 factor (ECF subfamily)